jgi:hypothetical protein
MIERRKYIHCVGRLQGQWPITATGKEERDVKLMGIFEFKVRQMVLRHTKGEMCESSVTVPFCNSAHNPCNLAK